MKQGNGQKECKQTGFTLIELLVVVAIIGALSSVVLSSVTEARERAYNAKVLTEVHQYVTALQLARDSSDDGSYPGGVTSIHCLGEPYNSTSNFSTGKCYFDVQQRDKLSMSEANKVKEHYSGYPSSEREVSFSSSLISRGYML